MDDSNITMEEYIRLEEEKARKREKVFNWETARYGKIWYDKDVYDLRSVENEFPAIVFNDNMTSNETLSCEPIVGSLNYNEIDFRISFDESDDEDYTVVFDKNSFSYKIISTNDLKMDLKNDNEKVNMPLFPSPEPTVSSIDDLDFFNDFENEFPAIVYNDALTSKSDFSTEPTLCPQHINEFDLKDEPSLSEYDEVEKNVLYFNDLFPFNIIYPDDLKSDKGNDDNEIDMIYSSGGNETIYGSNKILEGSNDKISKVFIMRSFVMELNVIIVAWNYLVNGMLLNLIKNLYVPFDIPFDPKRYYKDGDCTRIFWRPRYGSSTKRLETPGQSVFTSRAWRQLFNIRGPLVHNLILEFLRGVRRRMSWREFMLALGLHTAEEIQTAGFGLYWTESATRIPDKGDLSAYWIGISSMRDFLGMDVGSVNVPYLLARYLRLFTLGRKQGEMISGGPARQEGDAGRVVDEAPVTPRGRDEDEEIPQVVPPPPTTQGERISRLEEEVHGMREALQGHREGRCTLHKIFKVTGRVLEMHQARTDSASTSTAPQQPDP
ncbi:hypothetical protein Tco_0567365 [Tanacetum coccineum]